MINKLPIWNYPGKRPAFQDTESLTVLEASAKVYATLNEMIDDYNKFYEEVTKEFNELSEATSEEIQNFKDNVEERLCEKFHEIDERLAIIKQDTLPEVSEADNNKILAVIDGNWTTASITYDEATESLNIVGG